MPWANVRIVNGAEGVLPDLSFHMKKHKNLNRFKYLPVMAHVTGDRLVVHFRQMVISDKV